MEKQEELSKYEGKACIDLYLYGKFVIKQRAKAYEAFSKDMTGNPEEYGIENNYKI